MINDELLLKIINLNQFLFFFPVPALICFSAMSLSWALENYYSESSVSLNLSTNINQN